MLEKGRSGNLQIIGRAGVGLDNIDLAAAEDLGIIVVTSGAASARSVAEHALALAFAVARDIPRLDSEVRDGKWERRYGMELFGKTWGVVGLGRTGRATAELARGCGMAALAHDPYIVADDPEIRALGLSLMSLDDLLAAADIISVHLPLGPSTVNLFDRQRLSAMRPGSLLINVARGEIIDEEALADALESGALGGAGLDVRADEPPICGRLESSPHCVLTPHVAGLTIAAQERIVSTIANDIERVMSGTNAFHAVTSQPG